MQSESPHSDLVHDTQGLKEEPTVLNNDIDSLEETPKQPSDNNNNEQQEEKVSKNLESTENTVQDWDEASNQEKNPVEIQTPMENTLDTTTNSDKGLIEETHSEPSIQKFSSEINLPANSSNCSQKLESENNETSATEENLVSSFRDNEELDGVEPNQLPKLQLANMQEIDCSNGIEQSIQKNANETKKKNNLTKSKKHNGTTALKDNKGATISRKNSATLLSGQTSSPSPLKRRSSSRSFKVSEEKRSGNTSPVESDATSPGQQRMVSSKADSASSEHQMAQPSIVRRSSSKSLYKPTQSSAAKEKKKQEENSNSGRTLNTPKAGKWSSKRATQPNGNQTVNHEKQETVKRPSIGIARFMKPTVAASAKFSEKKSRESSVPKNSWKL